MLTCSIQLALFVGLGGGVTDPQSLSLEGYVRIPLVFGGAGGVNPVTSPYVQGTIGTTKVTFLVDTGATNCYLDLAVAKQLGLKLRPSGGVLNVDGIKHPTEMADVTDFRLGEVNRRGATRFDVHDMSKSIAHHKEKYGVEYHGIIGTNFLEGYSAIIDYRNKCLYLNDPSAWDLRLVQGSWKGAGCEWQGETITDKNYIAQAKVSITGDRIEFEHDGTAYAGTLQLDAIHSPKRYVIGDLVKNGKPAPGMMVLGLYEVDKSRLKLMMPVKLPAPQRFEDLPKKFQSSPENGMAIFTFEKAPRVQPVRPAGTAP